MQPETDENHGIECNGGHTEVHEEPLATTLNHGKLHLPAFERLMQVMNRLDDSDNWNGGMNPVSVFLFKALAAQASQGRLECQQCWVQALRNMILSAVLYGTQIQLKARYSSHEDMYRLILALCPAVALALAHAAQ